MFAINREKATSQGKLVYTVKTFDSLQEAMDTLYRQARRHGYEVTIDNTVAPALGFCLWQIEVWVGEWRYFVTEDDWSDQLFEF